MRPADYPKTALLHKLRNRVQGGRNIRVSSWSRPRVAIIARQLAANSLPEEAWRQDWFETQSTMSCVLAGLGPAGADVLYHALANRQVQHYCDSRVHAAYDKQHPLYWAVVARSRLALDRLLGRHAGWDCFEPRPRAADKDKVEEDGPSAHALTRNWLEGFERLTQAGARMDDSPLAAAARSQNPDLVRHLLAAGCDPAHRNAKGQTVLGRMARGVKNYLFAKGAADLTHEEQERWVATATPLVLAGAPLDAHDGLNRNADTVFELWKKRVDQDCAERLRGLESSRRLSRTLGDVVLESGSRRSRKTRRL